ncbi:Gfo/Idh/MocA family oxidoreductase [Nonomuraea recticatena]|uniref:Gfo/Idh/MocA family oxidoreductase n=1 Tax=Nonomuraea recticatena TaxID=46178 RepID=A0ABN3R8H2_9ACTN
MNVVLAGAHGFGRWHLRNIRRLGLRLAGVCDLVPLEDADGDLDGVPQSSDLDWLLRRTGAEVTIIATPIHTHADLARTALARGSHVLLEKPPVRTLEEFENLSDAVAESGLTCQVAFQSLGSHALGAVARLVADGAVGQVRGISVTGAWSREPGYYERAAWAGRREAGDGALTNPFAHGIATALCLAGSERLGEVAEVEAELFRAHPIDADDTSSLRVRTTGGTVVTVAVTLCAEREADPYVTVHGEGGRITLWYTRDEVRVGEGPVVSYGRDDLLENLLSGGEPLVPLARTGAFTQVMAAILTARDPLPIPSVLVGERRVVQGVDELVTSSADGLALFSEIGPPWEAG